ncbi:autotransporter YapH [Altererythrobacter sp. B11]|uniref:autotransporter domain-containing protein n=1 Tax=Altererythrobacter sp. B11 TaxID=2060312 RepID=UPI000DC70B52|nr:autotransporter domain-containing protein [Altererythrobacter sp. B11]BBC73464.1 autotransporter YapH [Altererythrobacter sp. B11]
MAATPALAEPCPLSITGDLTILSCAPSIAARVESGDTTLVVSGAEVGGDGIGYNPNGANVPTGPISMSLTVSDTTVNSTTYGGVNIYSSVAEGSDVTVTVTADSSITSTAGYGGVWVRNEQAGNIGIVNDAAITASGAEANGISATTNRGGVSVSNSGNITVTDNTDAVPNTHRGIYADGGFNDVAPVEVKITNSGNVNAYEAGLRAVNYNGTASIENSGTATSTTKQALVAWSPQGNVVLTNTSTGAANSLDGVSMQGATQNGDITIVNDGQAVGKAGISAVAGFDPQEAGSGDISITNTDNLDAWDGTAIYARTPDGDVTITNSGTVDGSVYGIDADTANGMVRIVNSGTITGGSSSSSGGVAIITGNAATTIVNSGIIQSNGSDTIVMGSGDVTLELHAGSLILGPVVDADFANGVNTLVLGGDSNDLFNAELVGNSYQGFTRFSKTGQSVWTLNGIGTNGWTVEAGTLKAGSADALGVDQAYTVNGGTLDIASFTAQIGTLGGTADGTVNIGSGGTLMLREGVDGAYAGHLTGTGTFEKVGTGTLALIGDSSTFAGNITVDAGTLEVRNALTGEALSVGGTSDAALIVSNGGTLDVQNVWIEASGSNADVTVEGTTAKLVSAGAIQIARGPGTSGSLTVRDGGVVETSQGGLYMGAGGSVNLSGAGTALRIGTLHSDLPATFDQADGWFSPEGGIISVTDGAHLEADGSYIGGSGPAVTQMTVDGAGTAWSNGLPLYIGGTGNGDQGKGSVTVSGGATVTSYTSALGVDTGSEGTLVLSGPGTTYSVLARQGFAGNMRVGYSGTGTATVENGAALSAAGLLDVASQDGSSGTLIVRSGGQVSANALSIGGGFGANGMVSVDGLGSSLTIGDGGTTIGGLGAGSITLSNGGRLESETIAIGEAGALNIGADGNLAAAAAGTVEAGQIVLNSGRLVLNHLDDGFTLAAVLSGVGTVDQLAGTSTLTGDSVNFAGSLNVTGGKLVLAGSTNAVSTFVGNNGVLQIGSGGTSGSLNGDILNEGTLAINRSDALVHNRVISGTGGLLVAGGTITLGGMNTFTGATQIGSGATLALAGQGRINQSSLVTVDGTFDVTGASSAQIRDLAGSGTIVLGDAGLIIADASHTFSGSATGTGGLTVQAGTLTLTGDSDFAGGLGIGNEGVVNIGDGGTTGSITAGVTNYGTLRFDRADDIAYAGQITGQGTVVKTGANTLTLTGSMSGVKLDLQQGTAVFLGSMSSSAALAAGTSLVFANPGTTSYKGSLTGTGSVLKTGEGAITFSGNSSTFGGNTTVDGGTVVLTGALGGGLLISTGGTVQVGNGVKDGDLLADTTNNGTLIFDQTGDYEFTRALAGDGGLIKRGDGALLLSGAYSYTGSTVVEGGLVRLAALLDSDTDLVVDNGTFDLDGKDQQVSGLSGEAGNLLLGGGSLTVNQEGNSEFAGSITGGDSGSFTKTGAGSLNLSGTSGFTGAVNVNGGRLAINGTLPAQVTVNSGGTLGGNGTAGTLTVLSGGTLAPGNSIGTLNVAGDVSFQPGSVYSVELNAEGESDRLIAGGTATIAGGTVSVLAAAGNYRSVSDYVILSAAGGVTGEFEDTDVDLPFLTPSLRYDPNDVVLTLVRNDRSFASAAITPNQRAVAAALDGGDRNSALYRAVAGQTDAAGAVRAFDALSGELWATTSTFMIDRTRRLGEMVVGRLEQADTISQVLAEAPGAARETQGGRTGIWGQAAGSWNSVKSDGNAARATQDSAGFTLGLDTLVGNWRIGTAFTYGEDEVRLPGRGSHASIDGSSVAAYAGGGWGALRVRLGGSYSWMDVKGARQVSFPSVEESIAGNYDGKAASGFAELSYAAKLGTTLLEPFAGVNHVHVKTDGFAETGGELGELQVAGQTRDVTYTSLGLRLSAVVPISDRAVVTPRASAAWLRGFGDRAAFGTSTLSAGSAFTIEGLPVARDSLRLEAGAQANILPGGSLGISYVGNLSDRWSDHGLKLGFSYSF